MGAYPGDVVGFAVAATLTHALLGYALGSLLFDAPRAGVVGGLVADSDHVLELLLGSPFVHRGVMHSALAVGVAGALATRYGRRPAGAVAVGYASHVLLDATTPMGVMLGYPLSTANVGIVLSGHSPPVTALLWGCCLLAVLAGRRDHVAPLRDGLRDLGAGGKRLLGGALRRLPAVGPASLGTTGPSRGDADGATDFEVPGTTDPTDAGDGN